MTKNQRIALIGNVLMALAALFIGYVVITIEGMGAVYGR